MRTNNIRSIRLLLAGALAIGVHLVFAHRVLGEEDHLEAYKIKDLNQIPAPSIVTTSNQFGSELCELKKPQFFLAQSEMDSGDDPRGGPAGNFVCYKAKCTGSPPSSTAATSQFGAHSVEFKKAKLICLPVELPPPGACASTFPDCNGTCPAGGSCTSTGSECVCFGPECGLAPPSCGSPVCPAGYTCTEIGFIGCQCLAP